MSAAVGWAVILRDLPFFTHAVGAGAYPVVLLCLLAGTSVAVGALAGAAVFAALLALLLRIEDRAPGVGGKPGGGGALVGLLLVVALAIGAVIVDVAGDGRLPVEPEGLLFGSLLAVDGAALVVVVVAAAVAALTATVFFTRWLAGGFDPGVARGSGTKLSEVALLTVVALCVAAVLPLAGSLLAGALLIIPAATVRLLTDRARRIPPWTLALAAAEGVGGLHLALTFDLPSGAAIAGLSGLIFVAVAAMRRLADRGGVRAVPTGAVIALGAMLFLAGCGTPTDKASDPYRWQVVASTPQVADIVRHVAGDMVRVTTLMPTGVDPHEFEPRATRHTALAKAGVIFRSGGELDDWTVTAAKASGATEPPVDLSRAVVLLAAPQGKVQNAHWYMTPANVARAAQRVRDELIKAFPPARETFRANTDDYLAEIERTQAELDRCISKVPADRLVLVSGHEDFDYLADAFGMKVAARLNEAGGERRPSARRLRVVIRRARSAGARALVTDRGGATQLDRDVARELGIPLLALYSDNLTTGDDPSPLLGAIKYDVGRIASAVTDGAVKCGTIG